MVGLNLEPHVHKTLSNLTPKNYSNILIADGDVTSITPNVKIPAAISNIISMGEANVVNDQRTLLRKVS